ncbi:MAG TPA: hypothetical protein VGR97_03860 [Candidatus Acidoferrales bacterium]|nr:hypothetical protein [Candidatus Acidoferrales bacterium]
MEQTGKGKFMLAVLGLVVAAKDSLHLLEEFRADERRVRAAVEFVFPDELAFVEGILEQSFEIAFGEKLPEFVSENLPHTCQRMLS